MTTRTIKKYPNRRLYDTADSKYVTVDQIRELIVAGTNVEILEDSTGNDITRSVLLQVLTQQEQGGKPVLSDRALTHLIRFYGHPLQAFMAGYIDNSLDMFAEQQNEVERNVGEMLKDSPAQAMQQAFSEMTASNMQSWNSMQKAFLDQVVASKKQSSESSDDE